MKLEIYPSKLKGEVEVPGSKSLTHRAILAAALSDGKSVLKNVSYSVDVLATLNAVKALGVGLKLKFKEVVVFGGVERICLNSGLRQVKIYCHDSGSTLRFLIPIVAALGLNVKFVCSKRLISRLCECGLFYCKVLNDCVVVDEKLNFGSFYFNNYLTSQFITGLLLVLPVLNGKSTIFFDDCLGSKAFINLTVDFLNKLNIKIKLLKNCFEIEGCQKYSAFSYFIDGDYSQAAFFAVAGCLNRIKIKGLKEETAQSDAVFFEILRCCGVNVSFNEDFVVVWPKKLKLKAFNVNVQNNPDLALPLAVLATMCCGTSKMGGVFRLKFKESNRISSILSLIRSLGGRIEIKNDDLEIEGLSSKLEGGQVNCFNDHRVAMAATICSVFCKGKIVLSGVECVNKSYVNFFEHFVKLGGKLKRFY